MKESMLEARQQEEEEERQRREGGSGSSSETAEQATSSAIHESDWDEQAAHFIFYSFWSMMIRFIFCDIC